MSPGPRPGAGSGSPRCSGSGTGAVRARYRLLGDHGEAEDVVQGVPQARRAPGAGRPDLEVAAWLRRVCLNTAYNRLRGQRRASARLDRAARAERADDEAGAGRPRCWRSSGPSSSGRSGGRWPRCPSGSGRACCCAMPATPTRRSPPPSTWPSARSGSCWPAASGPSARPTSTVTTRPGPTMPCPDLGALQASIDAPDGTSAPLHDHVRTCAACADTLAELQRNAELAAPAIALTAPGRAVPGRRGGGPGPLRAAPGPAGRGHPHARPRPPPPRPPMPRRRGPRWPRPVPLRRRGRVARLGTGPAPSPPAWSRPWPWPGSWSPRAAGPPPAGFLAQFRSQRFEVISLDPAQSNQVADVVGELVETGVFTGTATQLQGFGEPRPVTDLAEASRIAGFDVAAVDPSVLPAGVERTPSGSWPARPGGRITFDRDAALDYLRRHGRPDAQLPERYDGTELVVHPRRGRAAVRRARRRAGPAGRQGRDARPDDRGRGQPRGAPRGRARPARPPGRDGGAAPGHRRLAHHPALPVPADEVRWRPDRSTAPRPSASPTRRAGCMPCSGSVTGTSGVWPACSPPTRRRMSRAASADQAEAIAGTGTTVPAIATSDSTRPSGPGSPSTT